MSTYTAQRSQALDRANMIRTARAKLKRAIASGEMTVARVLLDPPDEAHGLLVADALKSQHRWGEWRTRHLLALSRIPERKLVGALTVRQRHVLAAALGQAVASEGEELVILRGAAAEEFCAEP